MNERSVDFRKGLQVGDMLMMTFQQAKKHQHLGRQACLAKLRPAAFSRSLLALCAAFSFPRPDVPALHPAFLPPVFLWACVLCSVMLVSNTLEGSLRSSRE